jgi:hypothetical protein
MKGHRLLLGLVTTLLLAFSMTRAAVWYVHPDSTLNRIQDGLDSCSTGDTVLVGPGFYTENLVWPNTDGILLTSEFGPEVTIIDGDSVGSVLTITCGVDSATMVKDLTIQNGIAECGGGIYLINSNPSLENLTITDNVARPSAIYGTGAGGGIYCNNSNPSLKHLTITGNTARPGAAGLDGYGGGICCCNNSSPNLTNVTISGNIAIGFYNLGCGGAALGGGIYCTNTSNPCLTDVIITGNTASHQGCHGNAGGGGIYCVFSSMSLANVIISGNIASGIMEPATEGGGIYCSNSNLSLLNTTISGNIATAPSLYWVYGGGINCSNCILYLRNVVINANSAGGGGGAICCNNSSPSLENVTMTQNTAGEGGGIYCGNPDPSFPDLLNCILWNDTPQEIHVFAGSVTAIYSDIQGGWSGTGNIYANPMFVSGPLSEFHLSSGSPCVDAGDPDPQYNDPEDPLHPGYALWPALGMVRNDMGVYGGPGAGGWVYIEEYYPRQPMSAVLQVSPNPFRHRTEIRYVMQDARYMEQELRNSNFEMRKTRMKIYDAMGRLVKSFRIIPSAGRGLSSQGDGAPYALRSSLSWDGRDDQSSKLPSGVYYLILDTGDYCATEKLLLIK